MQTERRRFFRIDDTVALQVTQVGHTELERKLEDFWANRNQYARQNEYNLKINEHLADLQAIHEKMPELARYLRVLQDQIDLLSKTAFPEQISANQVPKTVSLSAQGLSFHTHEIFKPVDIVELNLTLKPTGQRIVSFARVVLADEIAEEDDFLDEGRYRVSLDFEHIHEADRETLVRHIHAKQVRVLGTAHNERP